MFDDYTMNLYTAEDRNCIPVETTIKNVRLATAYVPFQKFCATLSPIKSLLEGTAFPELVSPYMKGHKMVKEKMSWTEMHY